MANTRRGEYPLKIKDVQFTLKFDTNAFAELEGALGEPLHKILEDAENNMGIRFMRAALYAGLYSDPRFKKKFTVEKAGELITAENLTDITESLKYALVSAMTGKTPDEIESSEKKESSENTEGPSSPLELS
jgi:hypothetical protein